MLEYYGEYKREILKLLKGIKFDKNQKIPRVNGDRDANLHIMKLYKTGPRLAVIVIKIYYKVNVFFLF